jgi:branched-chain amino acid transport system substrate-binding protein
VVPQVTAFPFSATSNVVHEYQQLMEKRRESKNPSVPSMIAFMMEGLRRTGPDLIRERFVNTLDSRWGKLDCDGW